MIRFGFVNTEIDFPAEDEQRAMLLADRTFTDRTELAAAMNREQYTRALVVSDLFVLGRGTARTVGVLKSVSGANAWLHIARIDEWHSLEGSVAKMLTALDFVRRDTGWIGTQKPGRTAYITEEHKSEMWRRSLAGETQAQIAAAIGVSQGTVCGHLKQLRKQHQV